MSQKLEIQIHGYDIIIESGEISHKLKGELEDYCSEKGMNFTEIWNYILINIDTEFDDKELSKIVSEFDYYEKWKIWGMIHDPSNEIYIYVDDTELLFNRDMIRISNHIKPKPSPRKGYISISHGYVDKGGMSFECEIVEPFDLNLLEFVIVDYIKIGYDNKVITRIFYDGNELIGDTLGTSGKYNLDVLFHE